LLKNIYALLYFTGLKLTESTCMKNKIDLMAQVLQKNNLGNFIPEGAKKKNE
jgi:hypothetical protein